MFRLKRGWIKSELLLYWMLSGFGWWFLTHFIEKTINTWKWQQWIKESFFSLKRSAVSVILADLLNLVAFGFDFFFIYFFFKGNLLLHNYSVVFALSWNLARRVCAQIAHGSCMSRIPDVRCCPGLVHVLCLPTKTEQMKQHQLCLSVTDSCALFFTWR